MFRDARESKEKWDKWQKDHIDDTYLMETGNFKFCGEDGWYEIYADFGQPEWASVEVYCDVPWIYRNDSFKGKEALKKFIREKLNTGIIHKRFSIMSIYISTYNGNESW